MFSAALKVLWLLSLSRRSWWQAAPGNERDRTIRASSAEENSAKDLTQERAPDLAPEQDEAEAALLPPAAHLLMVVCCEEDWRQPQSLGHAAGGEDRLGGQGGEPSAVRTGGDRPLTRSRHRSTCVKSSGFRRAVVLVELSAKRVRLIFLTNLFFFCSEDSWRKKKAD